MKLSYKILSLVLSLVITATFMPTVVFASAPKDISAASGSSGNCLPNGSFELVTPEDVAIGQPVAKSPGKNATIKTSASDDTKKLPLLIIVIGFNNVPYDNNYDWASTIFSEDTDDWSLAKYYKDNSHGKFTFSPVVETSEYGKNGNNNIADKVNDGIVHVSASMDHYNWIFPEDEPRLNLVKWNTAIKRAMNAANKYVDFSEYDRNGNKEIETSEMALGFVVAGGEAAYNDNLNKGIDDYLFWSQASKMRVPSMDGVEVSNYIAIAENTYFRPNPDGGNEYEKPFAPYNTLGEPTEIEQAENEIQKITTVDTSDGGKLYRFIPRNEGRYWIGSECTDSNADPIARAFDSDGNLIDVYDDVSANNNNFEFYFYSDEETDHIDVQFSDWNSGTSYPVYFREDFENWFGDSYFEEELPAMTAGQKLDVTVSVIDDYKSDTTFIFNPDESGWYTFYSADYTEGNNPIGRVLDCYYDTIASNDDANAGEDRNFSVDFYAEEGATYLLQAGDQNSSSEYTAGLVKSTKDAAKNDSEKAAKSKGLKSGESAEDESENVQAGIGSIAHELGHYLGLPDYYDTVYGGGQKWSRYDVEDLSIMCHGGWCSVSVDGNRTFRPSSFDAYSRVRLGWDDATEVSAEEIYTVKPDNFTSDSPYNVLKVKTEDADQYYLIENRQYNGWDEGLKESYSEKNDTGGLVMWHVDEDIIKQFDDRNEINTSDHRPGLMPSYMEYDESDTAVFKFIGSKVDTKRPFFDKEKYDANMSASEGKLIFLPIYNGDDPTARVQSKDGKGLLISGTGEKITLQLVDKTHEHRYGNWTVTRAATELSPGLRNRICTVCGHNESEVIRQLSPTLKAVSIKKPVARKKSVIVKWKKLSKNNRKKSVKIQIQYSTDKKFRKNVRTAYAGKKTTRKKISNLKRDKRYYIRVRAYKKSSTGVHISKWSKVKSVKLK